MSTIKNKNEIYDANVYTREIFFLYNFIIRMAITLAIEDAQKHESLTIHKRNMGFHLENF